jgi:hypothetical protein
MKTYGLNYSSYEDMLSRQEGMCAICTSLEGPKLTVDHNHKTGKIRGLLCDNCNKGLGMFRDNPSALASAITYLLRRST